ncbi:uncharacterized protein A4U43_C05F9140 [Asparagus officinalis]|uniref:Uncharacterized protein n=1 Tax=Asparagus officinalis TaxID=4686 RepID=A0A5P1EU47_ASPOF|nr:uncharacterized protein A4U43_C05F9140 [Asparagus officinalis]
MAFLPSTSLLLLLLSSAILAAAAIGGDSDMSIIAYNEQHGFRGRAERRRDQTHLRPYESKERVRVGSERYKVNAGESLPDLGIVASVKDQGSCDKSLATGASGNKAFEATSHGSGNKAFETAS